MIYAFMLGLAIVLMAPLVFAFLGGRRGLRNRRETALKLHRDQLAELARDLADQRIAPSEYEAAKLEIERRLLAADAFTEPAQDGNSRLLLWATIIAVPVMAFALYLPGSTPNVPSEPHAQWVQIQDDNNAKLIGFIAALRMRLATEDPNSPDGSQGEAYLAEALSEQAGEITPEALAYFKQSLANAPAGASWRALDEQRLAQAASQ
jgi:cytochrome c-type biogenesis protein CcmH